VPTYYAAIHLDPDNPALILSLTLSSFELKIGTSVTPAMWEHPHQFWFFCAFCFFCFWVRAERQTEGQADC